MADDRGGLYIPNGWAVAACYIMTLWLAGRVYDKSGPWWMTVVLVIGFGVVPIISRVETMALVRFVPKIMKELPGKRQSPLPTMGEEDDDTR